MFTILAYKTPNPSTLSVEDFRVRTYPPLARVQGWRVSAPGCFSRWPASFASYDPASSSWRTFQRSLLRGWMSYSGRWPLSGMMRAGEVCEHRRWAHRTAESGGSVSRGWPTMTASEGQRGHGYQRAQGRIDPTLTGATGAARAWPTPSAVQGNNAGSIQEWGGSQNPIRKTDPELARGSLNCTWVEALQGFPPGWTLTDGPPLRGYSTHGSHPEPDPASRTTETD